MSKDKSVPVCQERVCDMTGGERLENVAFFKGKRVFVTGHTGFKGAWLAAVLNFMGADAAGYALQPEHGCLYEKICGDGLIHNVTGNLLDSSLLEQTVDEIQPEIVIHLAGFGMKQDCLREPVRTFRTNLMGSTVLLEALKKCPSVKSIVLESSGRQFEDKKSSPASDSGEAFDRADIYSGSRRCMEYMARDYRELYFQADGRMTGIAAVRTGYLSNEYVSNEYKDFIPLGNGIAAVQMKDVAAGNECMQDGTVTPVPEYSGKDSGGRNHRLSLSGYGQTVLDILDGCLTVSRLLYEKPSVYAGEWDIELRQDHKSGPAFEKTAGQMEACTKCRIDGESEREACMRMISAYYRKR